MAQRERQVRMYNLHSWSGMVLGLFVYLVSFTGCFALFHDELTSWEDPAGRLQLAEEPALINETFSDWVEARVSEGRLTFLDLTYPSTLAPYYAARANIVSEDGETLFHRARWSSLDASSVPVGRNDLSTWLYDLHRDLMWPDTLGGRQMGLIIVGIAGIVLSLSILTGIIAHTKIVQDFHTLRYNRSVRLRWQDSHKTIGLWGLPFFIMIAATGAVLGFLRILIGFAAIFIFEGDQQALFQEVAPQAFVIPAGVEAPMISVDEVARMAHPSADIFPRSVRIENWGDQNARFNLDYAPQGELKTTDLIAISGVDGTLQAEVGELFNAPAFRVQNAINGLHYGTYGGVWLKLLYFVLGLMLALIIALGSMMWLERRLHGNEGRRSNSFYRALSRITIGVTLGLPLATAMVFHADKLFLTGSESQIVTLGWIYFCSLFTAIIFAFLRRQDYRATVELLSLIGALCLLLPLTNTITTGDLFLRDLVGNFKAYALVDSIAVLLGAGLVFAATRIPRKRPEGKRAAMTKSGSPSANVMPQQNRI